METWHVWLIVFVDFHDIHELCDTCLCFNVVCWNASRSDSPPAAKCGLEFPERRRRDLTPIAGRAVNWLTFSLFQITLNTKHPTAPDMCCSDTNCFINDVIYSTFISKTILKTWTSRVNEAFDCRASDWFPDCCCFICGEPLDWILVYFQSMFWTSSRAVLNSLIPLHVHRLDLKPRWVLLGTGSAQRMASGEGNVWMSFDDLGLFLGNQMDWTVSEDGVWKITSSGQSSFHRPPVGTRRVWLSATIKSQVYNTASHNQWFTVTVVQYVTTAAGRVEVCLHCVWDAETHFTCRRRRRRSKSEPSWQLGQTQEKSASLKCSNIKTWAGERRSLRSDTAAEAWQAQVADGRRVEVSNLSRGGADRNSQEKVRAHFQQHHSECVCEL